MYLEITLVLVHVMMFVLSFMEKRTTSRTTFFIKNVSLRQKL